MRPSFDDSNSSQPKRSFVQASRVLTTISSIFNHSQAQVEAALQRYGFHFTRRLEVPRRPPFFFVEIVFGVVENACAKFQHDSKKKVENLKSFGGPIVPACGAPYLNF